MQNNDRYSRWNMSNHVLSEGGKKEQKLINTNVITRHNAIAISCDQQSWRSSFSLIQIYLLFPVFNLWNHPFCRLILCTFPRLLISSISVSQICFYKLQFFFSRICSVTVVLWIFKNCVIYNILQSFNVCSSVILSKYIVYILWEFVFSFGKCFIKVHRSLLKFLESVLLFTRKYLLFVVFTICVYFWNEYL